MSAPRPMNESDSPRSSKSWRSADWDPWHKSGRFAQALENVMPFIASFAEYPEHRGLDRLKQVLNWESPPIDQDEFVPLGGVNTLAKAKEAYKDIIDAPITMKEWNKFVEFINYAPVYRYGEEFRTELGRIHEYVEKYYLSEDAQAVLESEDGSYIIAIIARNIIRRRWTRMGMWNGAWGCPSGPLEDECDDPNNWTWIWDGMPFAPFWNTDGVPLEEDNCQLIEANLEHPVARLINGRMLQKRGQAFRRDDVPQPNNQETPLEHRLRWFLSRPWVQYNIEVAAEGIRIMHRISNQQSNLKSVLRVDPEEIKQAMRENGQWDEAWSQSGLVGWTWPDEEQCEEDDLSNLYNLSFTWDQVEVDCLRKLGFRGVEANEHPTRLAPTQENFVMREHLDKFSFDQASNSGRSAILSENDKLSPKTIDPLVTEEELERVRQGVRSVSVDEGPAVEEDDGYDQYDREFGYGTIDDDGNPRLDINGYAFGEVPFPGYDPNVRYNFDDFESSDQYDAEVGQGSLAGQANEQYGGFSNEGSNAGSAHGSGNSQQSQHSQHSQHSHSSGPGGPEGPGGPGGYGGNGGNGGHGHDSNSNHSNSGNDDNNNGNSAPQAGFTLPTNFATTASRGSGSFTANLPILGGPPGAPAGSSGNDSSSSGAGVILPRFLASRQNRPPYQRPMRGDASRGFPIEYPSDSDSGPGGGVPLNGGAISPYGGNSGYGNEVAEAISSIYYNSGPLPQAGNQDVDSGNEADDSGNSNASQGTSSISGDGRLYASPNAPSSIHESSNPSIPPSSPPPANSLASSSSSSSSSSLSSSSSSSPTRSGSCSSDTTWSTQSGGGRNNGQPQVPVTDNHRKPVPVQKQLPGGRANAGQGGQQPTQPVTAYMYMAPMASKAELVTYADSMEGVEYTSAMPVDPAMQYYGAVKAEPCKREPDVNITVDHFKRALHGKNLACRAKLSPATPKKKKKKAASDSPAGVKKASQPQPQPRKYGTVPLRMSRRLAKQPPEYGLLDC